jgi:hypothetical protein
MALFRPAFARDGSIWRDVFRQRLRTRGDLNFKNLENGKTGTSGPIDAVG